MIGLEESLYWNHSVQSLYCPSAFLRGVKWVGDLRWVLLNWGPEHKIQQFMPLLGVSAERPVSSIVQESLTDDQQTSTVLSPSQEMLSTLQNSGLKRAKEMTSPLQIKAKAQWMSREQREASTAMVWTAPITQREKAGEGRGRESISVSSAVYLALIWFFLFYFILINSSPGSETAGS